MRLEPDWIALVLFCLVWGACCMAFLTLLGMFPLRARPAAMRGSQGALLILGNLALLIALALGVAVFAEARLHWTAIVVAGGLVFLFAPTLFQAWPRQMRDSRLGLLVLAGAQLALLAILLVGDGLTPNPLI